MKKSLLFSILLFSGIFLSFTSKKSNAPKLCKPLAKQYSFIEGGKAMLGKDSFLVNSFFISKFEVSNKQYSEFLKDLYVNGKTELLKKARLDTANWLPLNKPFETYYHSHPAYDDYPVLNVTFDGAMLYCKWLGEKMTKMAADGSVYDFRLPSREEWLRAARGDNYDAPYSWNTPYLTNNKGQYLCNMQRLGAGNIHYDEKSKQYQVIDIIETIFSSTGTEITAPVKSYWPGKSELYNMNGNAAEMISTEGIAVGGAWSSTGYDIRNESEMSYTRSSPSVGFRPVLIITRK